MTEIFNSKAGYLERASFLKKKKSAKLKRAILTWSIFLQVKHVYSTVGVKGHRTEWFIFCYCAIVCVCAASGDSSFANVLVLG